MKLSRIYGAILCLVASHTALFAIAKTVISESGREPVMYANVGIIGQNIGTVTDSAGYFSLKIPAGHQNDSIRISSVGYVSQTFAVKDFINMPDTVTLADDVVMLREVVVKSQRIKHKTAGRKGGGGFIAIDVEGYKAAGQGIAIPIKVKTRAWLKEIGFTIVNDNYTLSHMKFRVNIYGKEGETYILENIQPVYFDYYKENLKDGSFSYAFPEEILLEKGNYYVELEFLENFSDAHFTMKTKPMTGITRFKHASHSEWMSIPFGVPVYVEYDCID